MILNKKKIDKLTTPGLKFNKSRFPLASKIAIGVLLLVAALAVFAPIVARFDPLTTSLPMDPNVVGGPVRRRR